jgi:hypothetical protein
MDLGQPERQTHNYFRHGTLDLFAALNVATGEILTRCTPQHRAQDFVAFLRDIDASVETGWRSTSCWTTSPLIRRRRCTAGCFGIDASTSTSRPPTHLG